MKKFFPVAGEDKLVEDNMNLVHFVIRHKIPPITSIEYDDLVQIGSVGLLEAVRRFDPTRGIKFSTYGVMFIQGHIYKHIRGTKAIKRTCENLLSLEYIYSSVFDNEETALEDLVGDDGQIESTENSIYLAELTKSLTDSEKKLLEYRKSGKIQKEIGKLLGVTQVEVSRRERDAFAKIRSVAVC